MKSTSVKPAPIAIGSEAPAFDLTDEHGSRHGLKEALEHSKGIVLFFYPGDLTPGCTMQLCAVRDDWKAFERAGITVFGVNHALAESHEKFSQKHGFPFPLLIDQDKKISALYGAVRNVLKKTVIRRTVVGIGPEGTIVFYRHGMPKNADILKAFG